MTYGDGDDQENDNWLGKDRMQTEAMLIAYGISQQERFLGLFCGYYDAVVACRDSDLGQIDEVRHRAVRSWGQRAGRDGRWTTDAARAGRITYPATEFARIVLTRPDLQSLHDAATRYLRCAAECLAEFEEDYRIVPGSDSEYWYWMADGAPYPTNHVHSIGNCLINLHLLTGEQKYRDRVVAILGIFLKFVRYEDDGSAYWRYYPYFFQERRRKEQSELIWKAAMTVPFIVRAHRAGYPIDDKLIEAISLTIRKYFESNKLSSNLIKTDSVELDPKKKIHLRISRVGDLLCLADRCPEIARGVIEAVTRRPDLFSGGWFGSAKTAKAYAALLSFTGVAKADVIRESTAAGGG